MENKISNNMQSTQEPKQMNITDRFITAMFLPKEYGRLLQLSIGKLISFLILLILLVSVIRYVVPVLGAIAGMGGMKNIIMNELPEFALQDGTFTLDEKLERTDELSGVYIIVDTSVEEYTKADVPANMVEAIMVSKSNILVYNEVMGMGGMVQENKFADYKDITITNETIAKNSFLIYFCLLILWIMLYAFEMIKYLLAGLFYAIVMFLLVQTMMVESTFGEVYRTAIYAQTTGAIVNAVMYCINIPILILTGNSFAMLITVILMNKAFAQIRLQSDYR